MGGGETQKAENQTNKQTITQKKPEKQTPPSQQYRQSGGEEQQIKKMFV